ncbi:hypothetical protein OQA88_1206 [Cercophora sp. LCS_1]
MRTSLILTASSLAPLTLAVGGFTEQCHENNLWYQTINSRCPDGWTSFDLDRVLGNNNGRLVWQIGGSYFKGCAGAQSGKTCNLQGSVLGCDCLDNQGNWHWATIDLGEFGNYLAY